MKQQLEKDIVGEWKFIRNQDNRKPKTFNELEPLPILFGKNINGYIFYEDKKCENKLGYFKNVGGGIREDRKTIYLGNKTEYKIEDDSLKIFDLLDSSWYNQRIFSIVGDTLTLQTSDSVFAKYARIRYKLDAKETYDKIIVSSSGCYGTCPILDISIDKNGDVLYFGEYYNTENGFYSSTISEQDFQNILIDFKKADIQNLKDNYQANWTDDEEVSITFIRNHKIIKTINDYGRQAPFELIWAYSKVRFLYQQIKLVPVKNEKLKLPLWRKSFEMGEQICDLSKSESFYLLTELYYGKEVSKKIEPKYKIQDWTDEKSNESIYTDGQFYKLADKTIDIGFDFITENNFKNRFRPKNEYER